MIVIASSVPATLGAETVVDALAALPVALGLGKLGLAAVLLGVHLQVPRLLGYEREEATHPWPLERIARLLFGRTRTVAWSDVRLR
jgi:hypothetical protein